jgi:isocitrate/isopropylmalate dehydrogenase
MAYTEAEISRLVRVAFDLARGRRKKVSSADKANVLASSRLWRTVVHEVHAEYPDVELEDVLVDACAMYLVRNPRHYDVIATENTFGTSLDEGLMLAEAWHVTVAPADRQWARVAGWVCTADPWSALTCGRGMRTRSLRS